MRKGIHVALASLCRIAGRRDTDGAKGTAQKASSAEIATREDNSDMAH